MRISTKLVVLATAVFFAVTTAACGSNAPSGGSNTSGSNSSGGSTGNPADAAKGFYAAVFSGGDVNSYLCTTNAAAAKAISQSMDAMKSGLAASGAKISTDGLKFDACSPTGDTAQVKVSGKLTTTVSGVSTDTDYPGVTINMKNESGSWKVCG